MKSIKNVTLFLVVSSVLAACGTTTVRAPIEDRNPQANKNQAGPGGTPATGAKAEDLQSQYVVKKGDTLYRIALDKGQSYSDIVTWNNLANPNDIKVGQVLRVAPPDAGSGGQTTGVASPSGVEVRPLGAGAVASAPSGNNKNAPRADKRPYSDAALADLQKNETADASSAKVIAKPIDKTAEKTVDPVIVDEIVWVWPVDGKVVANFDDNKSKGIDVSGKLGQDIYAAAAGTVMYAGSGIRGYGNLVIIKHSNNLLSAYAHNKLIVVKEKQIISKGQKIAEMGNSDSDSGVVKLHFEIRQQGKPVDPMKFLPGR
ncbi:peptidoglycan DD-metalloendopeptidase family protein [Solimicrobium silvestre]|nr:peptidoglycan DD-metalloendopeptidase family protein [Solimicrobium silvestre]